MEARPSATTRKNGLALAGPALVLTLGAFAYRALFLNALHVPAHYEVETGLFRPIQLPAPLLLGVAAWMLWMRWGRLSSLPRSSSRWAAAVGSTVAAALFVWALLTGALDYLLPSLAANLLAFAAGARGRAGCRVVLLPALVLLLGLRIPAPVLDEVVWHLQRATAAEGAWLVGLFVPDIEQSGVIISIGERTFHVIDACSGLRSIQILTLVALIVRELFWSSGRRLWLVVLCAPLLGHALNAVRIALVAMSSDPESLAGRSADHTPQGLAVLAAGSVILYLLGWGLAQEDGEPQGAAAPPAAPPSDRGAPWGFAAATLVLLGLLTVVLPPFPEARAGSASTEVSGISLPDSGLGWTSEELTPDADFLGHIPEESRLYRRYQRPRRSGAPSVVDVFIAFERPERPRSSRLLSSKLLWIEPEWSVEEVRPAQAWLLDRPVDLAVLSRNGGSEYAVVYRWLLRDEGFWQESLRSLLALDWTPFRRERLRGVVRLATSIPRDGPVARDRGKQTLDRFITNFRNALAQL